MLMFEVFEGKISLKALHQFEKWRKKDFVEVKESLVHCSQVFIRVELCIIISAV